MSIVTNYDWNLFQQKCRSKHIEWLRGLADSDSIALYRDLYHLAYSQHDKTAGWQRLERERWNEKVSIRRRQYESFARLD